MPKQQLSLRMIKDLLRLKWHANLSHEQVAAALKISKGVVAKYLGLATAAGLDWNTVQHWNEQQLCTALQARSATASPVVVPDWGRIHRELDRKGVTLMLLWQEYVEANPQSRTWRYTQFYGHYKAFAATLKRSMRLHRRAGEKMFIDYAGPTVVMPCLRGPAKPPTAALLQRRTVGERTMPSRSVLRLSLVALAAPLTRDVSAG